MGKKNIEQVKKGGYRRGKEGEGIGRGEVERRGT